MAVKTVRNTMMLGCLSIGCWTARIGAKEISRKAEHEANAKEGTLSTAKKLMAGVNELDAVQKAATMHRNWWATQSVEWMGTTRGYNAAKHMELLVEIGDRRRDYLALASVFTKLYPSIRAARQYDMGDLFDDKEFPPPADVAAKFYFDFKSSPVSNAADIRIIEAFEVLPKAELDALVAAQVEQENAQVRTGMREAADRLAKVVEKLHNKLSIKIGDTGHIFRDTLIENIVELVDLMPGLNITKDPTLDAMCKEAKKLTLYSPDELREDEVKRAKAAKEAKTLAAKLGGLFAD